MSRVWLVVCLTMAMFLMVAGPTTAAPRQPIESRLTADGNFDSKILDQAKRAAEALKQFIEMQSHSAAEADHQQEEEEESEKNNAVGEEETALEAEELSKLKDELNAEEANIELETEDDKDESSLKEDSRSSDADKEEAKRSPWAPRAIILDRDVHSKCTQLCCADERGGCKSMGGHLCHYDCMALFEGRERRPQGGNETESLGSELHDSS